MTSRYDWVTIQCPHCFKKTRYTNITPKAAWDSHLAHIAHCNTITQPKVQHEGLT
jgi:hypothetical protein